MVSGLKPSEERKKSPMVDARDVLKLRRDALSGIDAVEACFHGHAYDMHHHDEWLVGVTHAGVQDFFCRGQRRQSTAGWVILMEPGERHDGRALEPEGFRYSMLYLPQAWLGNQMHDAACPGFRDTLTDDPHLGQLILTVCNQMLSGGKQLALDQSLDALATRLRSHLGCRPPTAPDDRSDAVAERAMDYLRTYYSEPFGLEMLARVAGASDRFQLARVFRRRYGLSPHSALVQIRLAQGRAMLREQVTPAESALAAGFADQSHFGRWFRRAYGLTPGVYRGGRTNVPDIGRSAR